MGENIFMDTNSSFFQIDFYDISSLKCLDIRNRTKFVIMISNLKHTHPTLWLLYNKNMYISANNFRSVLIRIIFVPSKLAQM